MSDQLKTAEELNDEWDKLHAVLHASKQSEKETAFLEVQLKTLTAIATVIEELREVNHKLEQLLKQTKR